MTDNSLIVYTIQTEIGTDAWAWMKEAVPETTYRGDWAGDYYEWYGKHKISADLFDKFNDWMLVYERSGVYIQEVAEKFDWIAFNKIGIELASLLKSELGDNAIVRYMYPAEDLLHSDQVLDIG